MLHEVLLIMLALSPLSIFRVFRRPLELSYPLLILVLSIFQGDYSEKVLGSAGVSLVFDESSRIFMMASALVFAMVALKRRDEGFRESFLFLTSLITLSAIYLSNDLFNVYVLMEVLSVQAGLMALNRRNPSALWATLKYLLIGGIGANLYLVGVAIYYSAHGTFEIGLEVPQIARVFMAVGMMMRVGVFGFGMWLPQFHSRVHNELSALFSGAFVGGGIFPAMKIFGGLHFTVYLSIGGALVAVLSSDYKRILAGSTMGHVGAMLSFQNPSLYFLSHSVSKAFLFLTSEEVKRGEMTWPGYISALVSFASLSAFPMTVGGVAESGLDPLLKLSTVLSSSAVFSKISRVKPRGFSLSPVFLIPILVLVRPSPVSLLPLLALAGVFLKTGENVEIPLEGIEWNVAMSTLFLAGWLVWSGH